MEMGHQAIVDGFAEYDSDCVYAGRVMMLAVVSVWANYKVTVDTRLP